MVRQLARTLGLDITLIHGTGPQGRVLEADVKNFKGGSAGARSNATPAVRALAASAGVDLTALKGTGPGGRVVEGDVRAAAPKPDRRRAAAAPEPAPLAFTPAAAASTGEERAPFVGIRRKIAEKMQFSTRTVAHVTHMDECDMTAVLALREELKPEAAKRGTKLTFLPFIIKALTKTLAEFPAFNASLLEEEGEIVIKRYYNVGIAVSAPQGLVVPNIKGADGKDLFGLAAEISSLAEKVRANKIDVPSLQGGTITITNIGPIGGLFATPIVNHPEVAILGLMKLQKRPVARDGGIAIRDMMNLVLSFDHRVTDGADAARFMNTLIRHLENPRTLV
jgi:pyruvate dehydrogenase E2 component (dihydrolipoamide acetyltransferase)